MDRCHSISIIMIVSFVSLILYPFHNMKSIITEFKLSINSMCNNFHIILRCSYMNYICLKVIKEDIIKG